MKSGFEEPFFFYTLGEILESANRMPAVKFSLAFSFLLLVLIVEHSLGQSLSDQVLMEKSGLEDFSYRLKNGYRAFTCTPEEITREKLRIMQSFLGDETSPEILVLMVIGDYKRLHSKIETSGLSPYLKKDSTSLWESVKNSRLFIFTDDTDSPWALSHWINKTNYKTGLLSEKEHCELLTLVDVRGEENKETVKNVHKLLFEQEGKLPNFIRTDNPALWRSYADSISRMSFYHADVQFGNQPLRDVKWQELPGVKSCGPVVTTLYKLSPKKRGYWFSPDIFSFSGSMAPRFKVFQAYAYDIKEGLRYYLPFKEQTANRVAPYDNGIYTDVRFVDDPERGKVAFFNGKTSYIDFREARDTDFKEISISAWVKPEEIQGSLSLIGKGEAFSAKIFNGKLQFTTPGLKDHSGEGMPLKTGSWVHLTYVYSQDKKIYFYVNGKPVDDILASELEQTNHSVLIGSNLWGQYFKGRLSEFYVWNRALSDQEVAKVYASGFTETASASVLPYILGSMTALALGTWIFFFFRRRRKTGRPAGFAEDTGPVLPKRDIDPAGLKSRIQLLDEFRITGVSGMDMTFRFSPKRKELLLLLLLYTIKEGGVSSRKMGSLLWPGFSSESVKNNRSTHIKEIRNIFGKELDLHIVYANKMWRMEAGDTVEIDLWELHRKIPLFHETQSKVLPERQDLLTWAKMVSRGTMLPQTEVEWIDKFKSDYANRVLDILVPFIETPGKFSEEEELLILRAILTTDPLYEPAVQRKVAILVKNGKHTLAGKTIAHYKRLYENFYGEVYPSDFPGH
ncbi:DNA-binding transcriptional activator of the SARP family [Sinomicrobium oceani]|uniref:DNA-binding transcriptional activator of the SARP family n=2 Tax=Sinomicrobium oceani TaxID=1150368 RepID=A0A1K1LW56_9FLAO|nr:DNA-binding transcriptional activator of the SARP family [Sinomicrobium oceani]